MTLNSSRTSAPARSVAISASILLGCYLSTGILQYVLGTETIRIRYVVLCFGPFFVPQLLWVPKTYQRWLTVLLGLFAVGAACTFVRLGVVSLQALVFAVMQLGVVAHVLRHRISDAVPKVCLYAFAAYSTGMFILHGDFEHHYASSGRNSVSWIALSLCGLYYLVLQTRGIPPTNSLPALTAFAISVLAGGRAGIIVTGLLFLWSVWHCYRGTEAKPWKRLALMFVLVVSTIGVAIFAQTFYSRLEYFRTRGLQHEHRAGLNREYLSSLNGVSLVTGGPVADTLIADYANNPHNSYIVGHLYFGIMAIVIYFVFMVAVGIGLARRDTRLLAAFLLLALARMATDSVMFGSCFDFCIYGTAIYLIGRGWKTVSVNDLPVRYQVLRGKSVYR